MAKIDVTQTIFEIVENNPEILDFLIANGFEQFKNKMLISTMGKKVTLQQALVTKNINPETFLQKINLYQDGMASIDDSLNERAKVKDALSNVEGLLPCPIRMPLLDGFNDHIQQHDLKINYDLRSANLGLDFVLDKVDTGDIEQMPDVLISAGFELFFGQDRMGKYYEKGQYSGDSLEMHQDLDNDNISMRDPQKRFHILGVVPCVLLVNTVLLGDKPMPTGWEDIMSGRYDNSVSIPLSDLDMFNALMVNIYKHYGTDGIKALGRAYMKSLHPSQMVKAKPVGGPLISIIPYFFASMVPETGPMKVIWPKEGAIVSPIFLTYKTEKKEELKDVLAYFYSKEMGEIFSSNGKFPSTNPEVANYLSAEQNFLWAGWDFINSTDISALLLETTAIFNQEVAT